MALICDNYRDVKLEVWYKEILIIIVTQKYILESQKNFRFPGFLTLEAKGFLSIFSIFQLLL